MAWRPDGSKALIVGYSASAIPQLAATPVVPYSGIVLTYDGVAGGISSITYNTSAQLYDVAWKPDGTEALIVGSPGTIIRVQYSGTNFTLTGVSIPSKFSSIDFRGVSWKPSGNKALIVGANGTVLTYASGTLGEIAGTQANLWGVDWKSDGSYALIAGAGGKMLKYVDGTSQVSALEGPVSTSNNLRAIAYHDKGFALTVGDGGIVWRYEESVNTIGYRTRTVALPSGTVVQTLYGVDGYTVHGASRTTFHALMVGNAGRVLDYVHEVSLPAGPGPGPSQ